MIKRDRITMPGYVRTALEKNGLRQDYNSRPAYQQNDYLAWIGRAKTEATRQKRLDQMLDELRVGGIYMKMEHRASIKKTRITQTKKPN